MEAILTLVEKTALLKTFHVLAPVPTEALAQLAARTKELHFEAGEEVVRVGEPNRGSFLVVEGGLEVHRQGFLVRIVGPGMGFGELALAEGEPHSYSVRAMSHTHAINFTPDDLYETLMEFPEVGAALVKLLAERLQEMTDRVIGLEQVVKTLVERLQQARLEPPDLDQARGALDASKGVTMEGWR